MKNKREVLFFLNFLRERRGDSWMSALTNTGHRHPLYFFAGVRLRGGTVVLKVSLDFWKDAQSATLNVLPRSPGPVTLGVDLLKMLKDNIQ